MTTLIALIMTVTTGLALLVWTPVYLIVRYTNRKEREEVQ